LGSEGQLIFPPKWCHVGLAWICHFLVLDPYLKAIESNLWLSSNRIALFHLTWDLEPSSKVALILELKLIVSGEGVGGGGDALPTDCNNNNNVVIVIEWGGSLSHWMMEAQRAVWKLQFRQWNMVLVWT
jgi:hypothetical protein